MAFTNRNSKRGPQQKTSAAAKTVRGSRARPPAAFKRLCAVHAPGPPPKLFRGYENPIAKRGHRPDAGT